MLATAEPVVQTKKKKARSVSQVKQYGDCPYAYYLARVYRDEEGRRAWKRPAAWFAQGIAFHDSGEFFQRSGRTESLESVQDKFAESYAEHINKETEVTPNLDWWFRSGPYHAEQDIPRRREKGLEQVARHVEYYTEVAPQEAIWIADDGTPGIEIGFDVEIEGVQIIGFIDEVISHPARGGEMIRDSKTGNNPGDEVQLGVYKVCLSKQYPELNINYGDYWMARAGGPTVPFDLRDWTEERVAGIFVEMDEKESAGEYPALPETKKCMFCSVSYHCEFAVA